MKLRRIRSTVTDHGVRIAGAAALTLVLSAAVAHAQDQVRIRLGFDRHEALASGPLGACPLGDDILLSVTIRQGSTTARGD
jgi:hypothetical protein